MDIVQNASAGKAMRIRQRPVLLLGLIVTADYLLFRHENGINLFLMILGLCGVLVCQATMRRSGRLTLVMAAATVVAALPLVEAHTVRAFIVAAIGLVLTALAAARLMPASTAALPGHVGRYLGAIPMRIVSACGRLMLPRDPLVTGGNLTRTIKLWLMPVGMTIIFLLLFASANPVIERVLASIDLAFLLSLLDLERMTFWILMAGLIWLLLKPRLSRRGKRAPMVAVSDRRLVSDASLIRALLMFNGIFALQTVLDATYLWGGVALPDGMPYAEYAHRGAYPLLATALLSALFVLVAMHRERTGDQAALIRVMVYVWLGQNMLLCISSILRLDLYVEAYSLTELRIAAGIWMLMVAVGLGLIMLRILWRKPNQWLVTANLALLLGVFYVTAPVDFAAVIARFNIENSRELGGTGASLDIHYLGSLGPTVIPAIDHYLEHPRVMQTGPDSQATLDLRRARDLLAYEFEERSHAWQSWTWRAQRLADYLAAHPAVEK
ncbi:DUF4173 domain-containing protein [Rhizobium sp. RU36D]|uniref:DUF4153 domain-containing protein n=1 Tax=Rhizobium sp. RU36D TaxID=1907415 RepID=UPI0009D8E773|nr:DUF4173 domain-containing protein [Rhizobium sp. RU36D]SMC84418.1 protein of unknown function [Rhizobium sp. RU36D]